MKSQGLPKVRSFLLPAIILGVLGWGGLVFVFMKTLPNVGPRWLFFFFSVMAITGTFLPIVAFLNRRFGKESKVSHGTVLREALLPGVYFPTLAWLQLSRVLTPVLALLLAIGLALIEWLLRLREKSRWEPN